MPSSRIGTVSHGFGGKRAADCAVVRRLWGVYGGEAGTAARLFRCTVGSVALFQPGRLKELFVFGRSGHVVGGKETVGNRTAAAKIGDTGTAASKERF